MDRLVARRPDAFQKAGIDVRVHHRVERINLERRELEVVDLDHHQVMAEHFDTLVIATGALPVVPEVPGVDADRIFTVKSLEGAQSLRRALSERPDARVVVVGGGYIGLEMADNLRRSGRPVVLVDRNPALMSSLDTDMGELVTRAAEALGVTLALEETLVGFETDGRAVTAAVTDRNRHAADIVILGLGVVPDSDLSAEAGIPLGAGGAIHVDDQCRTGALGVFAAGDCADVYDVVARRHVYQPLATHANKQGRVAGLAIAGRPARFPGVTGTAITQLGETEVARAGLGEKEVRALSLDAAASAISSTTRVPYMPGTGPIRVKLWGERGSGRLLGGQIVGGPGSGKRIDVVATALMAGLTVDDLLGLDLAYAPGVSDTWDPVQVAARTLIRDL
ncbi:MAG: FAD-dependent oxidoreductase [Clostridia bacterium]